MLDMRNLVWEGILNTERISRYCSAQEKKFKQWHTGLSFWTAVAASGGMAALLAHVPDWGTSIILFSASVSAAILFIGDFSGKATIARISVNRLQHLSSEWENLWYSQEIQPERVQQLQQEYNRISSDYSIEEDEKLNEKAQREAYAEIETRFA